MKVVRTPGLSVAALTAQYFARRCVICGGEAQVHCTGSEAEYAVRISYTRTGMRRRTVLIHPAVAEIDLCLSHGAERWPWTSHKPGRVSRARIA
jgi:hypothetical protein